ncbi:MAG: hypothetical protein ACKO0M_08695 [Cyanobium sp.]
MPQQASRHPARTLHPDTAGVALHRRRSIRASWPARSWSALASLVIPFAAIQPQSASAQSARFALACIGTETGYTVNFNYRWGTSGQWRSSSVEPGRWIKLMWNYDYPGENRSPKLTVRYDDDATSRTNIVLTDLKVYAASQSNCEAQGKTYNFYQRGNELYIREED